MKNVKKYLAALLAVCMTLSLAACGSSSSKTEAPAETPADTSTEANEVDGEGCVILLLYYHRSFLLGHIRAFDENELFWIRGIRRGYF